MLKLDIEISDDRRHALTTIGVGTNGGDTHRFSAQDLDELIALLGTARMALDEEIPKQLEPAVRIRSIHNPILQVHKLAAEQIALCIRDPAYGWTALEMSSSDAIHLASALRQTG